MKISYNWLKWYIPEAPDAEKLADDITYHLAEVETTEKRPDGDVIFDIKILPNRAHDLLSHQGVARELASLLNIPFVDPTPKYKIPESRPTNLKIDIHSDKCRRYMGRIIMGVKVGPSPEWVVKHLESIGQRSINNMVDAANIVMFDCGQPTHVFDLDKMQKKSDDTIIVRQAKDGEEMTTLDKKEVKFKNTDLVIADSKNILAVAGVKGGKITEVDTNTKNIILEVANFDPTSVRKTAQSLNIFTDARKRFENDLFPELAPYAMREFSALILEMCPQATFEDIVDVYPQKQPERKLTFRIEKMISLLGVLITVDQVKEILSRYNILYTEKEGIFEIIVPPLRLDLNIEEDMAEEIGRIMGYDKVKAKLPKINFIPKVNETYAKILWARNKLLDEGYSEVMNTSFRDTGKISVLASASDKKFLRTNITDGLKESLKLNQTNAPLLGLTDVKIFEIGTVWNPTEEMHVAYGNKKEIKETKLDEFLKISPGAFEKEWLSIARDRATEQKHLGEIFNTWSLFPFITRDIALWAKDDTTPEEVIKIIKENMGTLVVRGPELFDQFKKDGRISYAFRLVFQSFERTLTDEEINVFMQKITNALTEKGFEIR